MMKKKMIVNDILCLFSCFFLMGCNAIKEDNTKVYVDSYSQTALQQADIIMDGIQSENCEEIADIFCTYIKKNHPELQSVYVLSLQIPLSASPDSFSLQQVRWYHGHISGSSDFPRES